MYVHVRVVMCVFTRVCVRACVPLCVPLCVDPMYLPEDRWGRVVGCGCMCMYAWVSVTGYLCEILCV